MITVTVNNESIYVNQNTTLEEVVLQKINHISQTGIAVALNDNVVQKLNWVSTTLKDKDNILIIKATQGG